MPAATAALRAQRPSYPVRCRGDLGCAAEMIEARSDETETSFSVSLPRANEP
jgi:hypothetical protein